VVLMDRRHEFHFGQFDGQKMSYTAQRLIRTRGLRAVPNQRLFVLVGDGFSG
jgi:hypothetical protein